MRIHRNIGQIPVTNTSANTSRARGSDGPPAAKDGASVVSIGNLNPNEAASETSPLGSDIAARLDEVRAQIAEGTYEINFDKLADSIARTELGGDEEN